MGDWWLVLGIAVAAGLASPLGGLLSLWRKPTTLFTSLSVGFAAGVLLGTIGFEMMPKALELGSIATAVLGFAIGFAAVYAFDLFVHRGKIAGPDADQRKEVERERRRKPPRGTKVTVLAGGTSAEELIEGMTIGVGAAIEPGTGIIVAVAIMIDNVSEALSIGELARSENESGGKPWLRVMGWTGLIGVSLIGSALLGWFLLQGVPKEILGPLFAAGAGGMFYLTIGNLVPEAEQRHYQQSAALATAAGFMVIFVLSSLM